MSGFPTKQELEEIIASGKLCLRCGKNPATLDQINAVWMIGHCEQCKKEARERSAKEKPSSGYHGVGDSDRVYSVHTLPDGTNLPVNKHGNVINPVHAKYERKPGEKPLW